MVETVPAHGRWMKPTKKNRCMGMAQFAPVPAVHSFSWYLWMFIYRFIWLVIIGWTHFLEKNIIETHSINDIQAKYIRRKTDLVQFTDVYHVLGVAVYYISKNVFVNEYSNINYIP